MSGEDSRGHGVLLDASEFGVGAGDSDADLSIRSEGPPFVHRDPRSFKDQSEHENARAIAEAEAGAIRDAVMADGTGNVHPSWLRRFDAMARLQQQHRHPPAARTSSQEGAHSHAQRLGFSFSFGLCCGSIADGQRRGYGQSMRQCSRLRQRGCHRRQWWLRPRRPRLGSAHGRMQACSAWPHFDRAMPQSARRQADCRVRIARLDAECLERETGEQVHLLAGHQHSVRCIEVAGNKVASGSYDGTCRVWDLDTGRCLHTLRGHIHYIYAVAFDGKRVATGSLDSTVRVWSAETGECLALFQGHTSLVGQLQLLDNTLVTGGSDGRVIVFSLKTYECLHRLCAHDNSVTCLQFDDRYIVTGGNDGRVKLWDFNTGKFHTGGLRTVRAGVEVSYRDDKVVVLCKRADKTCMDVITFRPSADEM